MPVPLSCQYINSRKGRQENINYKNSPQLVKNRIIRKTKGTFEIVCKAELGNDNVQQISNRHHFHSKCIPKSVDNKLKFSTKSNKITN